MTRDAVGEARADNLRGGGRPAVQRFGARAWTVDDPRIEPCPTTGCWIWVLGLATGGYGCTAIGNKTRRAHRVFWMHRHGPIPEGMFLDHICRNRACVNPDHLRVASPTFNALNNTDSIAVKHKARTHCSKGHPFSGDNLIIQANRKNSRVCRQCCRDRATIRNHRIRGIPKRLRESHA